MKKPIEASLRTRVYATAAKHGGTEEYNALKTRFLSNKDPGEVRDLICGMCQNKLPELHNEALEFCYSDSVRKQDKVFFYAYLGMNIDAQATCWEYVKSKWTELYEFYDGGFLVNWLARVPNGFNTEEQANEVSTFFESVKEESPCARRAMDQTVEGIRTASAWRNRDLKSLKEALSSEASN